MLYPSFKFMGRYMNIDTKFNPLDVIASGISIVGLVFLYNGQSLFVSEKAANMNFNNNRAYIYGILTVVCWSIANFMLHRQKVHIDNTVDCFFVGFFTTLIVPGFILCYFSMWPTRLIYDWMQGLYFLISGFFTFLFHS